MRNDLRKINISDFKSRISQESYAKFNALEYNKNWVGSLFLLFLKAICSCFCKGILI